MNTQQQLWASLYLPQLQLDACSTEADQSTPLAVIERRNNRMQIRHCNDAAHNAGISSQIPLNSAYAIVPSLAVIDYDEHYEATLLQQLGEWAMQYSSIVSLHPPCHVLLEIGASQQLFNSFENLIGELQNGLAEMGYHAQVGIAPTPLAANVLACAGLRRGTSSLQRLPQLLAELPIQCLELEESALRAMMRSGIRDIGAFLAVPGKSLTRRFGPDTALYVTQLLGQHPDPRTPIRTSDNFRRKLELALEIEDTNALQFTTQRLINELAGFLTARDSGVNSFEFILGHRKCDDTVLQLRFLQATSQAKHLHRVLSERLERTELPEPVIEVQLIASQFCEIERDAGDLFIKSRSQQKGAGEVIDQLRSRLGTDAVYTLVTGDDHRPEKSWQKQFIEQIETPKTRIDNKAAKQKKTSNDWQEQAWPERPLWLLKEPEPARQPLQLERGPERIECGWWEADDVRRDYYIACDRRGQRYWVFKYRTVDSNRNPELDGDTLYVHGLFG